MSVQSSSVTIDGKLYAPVGDVAQPVVTGPLLPRSSSVTRAASPISPPPVTRVASTSPVLNQRSVSYYSAPVAPVPITTVPITTVPVSTRVNFASPSYVTPPPLPASYTAATISSPVATRQFTIQSNYPNDEVNPLPLETTTYGYGPASPRPASVFSSTVDAAQLALNTSKQASIEASQLATATEEAKRAAVLAADATRQLENLTNLMRMEDKTQVILRPPAIQYQLGPNPMIFSFDIANVGIITHAYNPAEPFNTIYQQAAFDSGKTEPLIRVNNSELQFNAPVIGSVTSVGLRNGDILYVM